MSEKTSLYIKLSPESQRQLDALIEFFSTSLAKADKTAVITAALNEMHIKYLGVKEDDSDKASGSTASTSRSVSTTKTGN